MENYKKYRWFFTSSGTLIIGGKSAIQNDEIMTDVKNSKEDYIILHTSDPGSPFCIIQAPASDVSKSDIEEAAVFTGCFSKAWKLGKMNAKVDIFNSSQIHKNKNMNSGTWGVYGEIQRINVPLELIFTSQKGVLRAVPEKTIINLRKSKSEKKSAIVKITPGNIEKSHMLAKLELELDEALSEEEVMSAIPAGKFKIQRIL